MKATSSHTRSGRVFLYVLLAVFVSLAIIVFFVRRGGPTQPDVDEGRVIAEQFLESVRSGQASAAWESTTAEFKSAQGREAFLQFVKAHSLLVKPAKFVSVQTVSLMGSPRAEYVFRLSDGKGTARLLAGNERGTWRVDRLTVD